MGDIINLRRARKSKQRNDDARAAENARLASGRTKAEKRQTHALRALDEKRIDSHRLERKDHEPSDG